MKNMEKIQNLLNKVETIRQKAEKLHRKSYDHGEEFDVFSVVGLWDEEVKLHSAIIAELLDPHGSHGAGDFYLKQFLHILECDDFPLDAKRVKPNSVRKITERYIGRKTETTGGKIDIIIEDGKRALIIENKPGDEDQERQLLRYHNYAIDKYVDSIIIYLTKDGREASSYSTGRKRLEYKCLSFNDIINQYKLHLKKVLGNTMDDNNSKKLLELLTQKNNVLAVKEILCMGNDWLNSIIEEYLFKPLCKYAESKKMNCSFSQDKGNSGFYMYKDCWKYYGIFLWSDKNTWSDLYVGVSWYEQPDRKNKLFKKDFSKMICLSDDPVEDWPYGSEYLPSDIKYFGYDNADKIVNGEVYEWVEQKFDEILNEIKENKLRMP
jgi:hypothetical protein